MSDKPAFQIDVTTMKAAAEAKFGPKISIRKQRWADKAGVSVVTVSSFMRGATYIKVSTVEKLAAAVGLGLADVMRFNGNGKRKTA